MTRRAKTKPLSLNVGDVAFDLMIVAVLGEDSYRVRKVDLEDMFYPFEHGRPLWGDALYMRLSAEEFRTRDLWRGENPRTVPSTERIQSGL